MDLNKTWVRGSKGIEHIISRVTSDRVTLEWVVGVTCTISCHECARAGSQDWGPISIKLASMIVQVKSLVHLEELLFMLA